MFNKVLEYFKQMFYLDIDKNDLYNIIKIIKHFKVELKNIDPIKDNLLYIEITIVDKNILRYIKDIHNFLIEEKSNIPDILFKNNHREIYLIDFLKDEDNKLFIDSNIYLLELLDNLEMITLAYSINKNRKLFNYIIHVLNIYRTIYKHYKNI